MDRLRSVDHPPVMSFPSEANMTNSTTPRLLRRADVLAMTGLAKSTLYAAMQAGDFPRPVRLGKQAVAWRDNDVAEWIASRPIAA